MDTGELFMTFKLLKRRYRSTETDERIRRLDYFNQPFEKNSEIQLMDDINLAKPLALESLATQFEPAVDKRGNQNALQREDKGKKKNKGFEDEFDFEPFSFDQSSNF